jgi:hypothetical protein
MAKAAQFSEAENRADAEAAARMFAALNALPLALIGRVHGAAMGGGAGLAAVCDIVVADAEATFAFSEVKLGIIPAVIAPYALMKIGPSAARELFSHRRAILRRAREGDRPRPRRRGKERARDPDRRDGARHSQRRAPGRCRGQGADRADRRRDRPTPTSRR